MIGQFLYALVPTGVLLLIGRRIDVAENEAAARRAFLFLLGGVIVLLAAALLVPGQACCPQADQLMALAATAMIPVLLLQWQKVRRQHTNSLLVGGAALIALLLLLFALSRPRFGPVPVVVVTGSLVTLLMWNAARWQGRGRVLMLGLIGLLLSLVIVRLYIPNSLFYAWPEPAQFGLLLVSLIVWPLVVPILLGMIALHLITNRPYRIERIAAGLLAAALIVALFITQFGEVWLLDIANDDLGVIFVTLLPLLGAAIMTLLLIWSGRWRALAVFALLLGLTITLVNKVQHADSSPSEIAAARAAQIDTAIQAYYQDNGTYPDDLLALTPRYLLTLPNVVLFSRQTWCYESGSDYYRFGYVHRPAFNAPNDYITIKVAGEVGDLPGETWDCDAQWAAYHEKYAPLSR